MASPLKTALVAFAWLACTAPASLAQDATAPDMSEDPVVARVDDVEIRLGDLVRDQAVLPDQYRQMPMQMLFDVLRSRAIESALLAGEAERRDLQDDAAVQRALADMQRIILRNRLVEITVQEAVTEEALRARYAERAAEPGFTYEEVRASHILVEEEDRARELIAELEGGADFAELATEHSIDPAAANGGDLGYFVREQMVAPFAEVAFALEPGTIAEEPVQTQFGWHVIRVEDKRSVTPSFEELEPELREQVAGAAVTTLLDDLSSAATIERFDMHGAAVPAAE